MILVSNSINLYINIYHLSKLLTKNNRNKLFNLNYLNLKGYYDIYTEIIACHNYFIIDLTLKDKFKHNDIQ